MKLRSRIFTGLVGFFVGVITTLCLLVPGKIGPTVLMQGDREVQRAQLNEAGDKLEHIGQAAARGVADAKGYFKDRWQSQ